MTDKTNERFYRDITRDFWIGALDDEAAHNLLLSAKNTGNRRAIQWAIEKVMQAQRYANGIGEEEAK